MTDNGGTVQAERTANAKSFMGKELEILEQQKEGQSGRAHGHKKRILSLQCLQERADNSN